MAPQSTKRRLGAEEPPVTESREVPVLSTSVSTVTTIPEPDPRVRRRENSVLFPQLTDEGEGTCGRGTVVFKVR